MRYALEMSAYASFLLAVEPNATRPITFGTNAFWRHGAEGAPYARLHPQYHWPIGAPIETHPAEQLLSGYILFASPDYAAAANRSVVYGRQFANGIAVYNSGDAMVRGVSLPGGPYMYLDPHTNRTTTGTTSINLDARSGRVLLRHR